MTTGPSRESRRGRRLRRTYEIPTGTAEYAAEQGQYRAFAGQFRILAYTISPDLLLEREAWLWPQLWDFARQRQQGQVVPAATPKPVTGGNARSGTRLQYRRLAHALDTLASHPGAEDFPRAERETWAHIRATARERGWLADDGGAQG